MTAPRLKFVVVCSIALQILASIPRPANFQSVSHKNHHKDEKTAQNNQPSGVDDILKDTFGLLDMLDQKLTAVKNRTVSAALRDNLRAQDSKPILSPRSDDAATDDDALIKIASNFNSDRRNDQARATSGAGDTIQLAASEQQPAVAVEVKSDVKLDAESLIDAFKRSRQLNPDEIPNNHDIHSDPTDKHIKFTLDLMRSIFKSQSLSSEPNSIESFLISPLSIQMVLMMMHLGARGQTRREIGQCLHLDPLLDSDDRPPVARVNLPPVVPQNEQIKLKRRHQAQVPADKRAHSQQSGPTLVPATANAHELLGSAMRNLLKDAIVMKAFNSANQVLLQKNLPLSPQFSGAIKHYYGAEIKRVDFMHQPGESVTNSSRHDNCKSATNDEQNIQKMVNDWVERQSKGRITNFLTSPVSTSTLLMAMNVLFFKGDWQYKFDPADTQTDATFTQANGKTVKVPMMVSKLPLAFAHDPIMKTSVIELPYKAQRLGLFILLPDDISGIYHTMQMLNSTSFANLISSMRRPAPGSPTDVANNGINVRIPKFSIESSPRLSQILSQYMGLKSLFMPDIADLSGMFSQQAHTSSQKRRATAGSGVPAESSTCPSNTSKLSDAPAQVGLDELLHKAVLQVDEQGSVAAASSTAIVERVGLFNSNYFEADHPFLLFLMDKQTGLVLFSGAYAGDKMASGGSSQPPNHDYSSSTNSSSISSSLNVTSQDDSNTNKHSVS